MLTIILFQFLSAAPTPKLVLSLDPQCRCHVSGKEEVDPVDLCRRKASEAGGKESRVSFEKALADCRERKKQAAMKAHP